MHLELDSFSGYRKLCCNFRLNLVKQFNRKNEDTIKKERTYNTPPAQVLPHYMPVTADWDRSKIRQHPTGEEGIEDRWMEGWKISFFFLTAV